MKGTSLCRKRFINVKIRNAIKVFLLGKEHKNGISEEVELRTEAYPSFRSRSFGMLSRGFMCLLWQMSLRFLCNFAVTMYFPGLDGKLISIADTALIFICELGEARYCCGASGRVAESW